MQPQSKTPGIQVRHSRGCPSVKRTGECDARKAGGGCRLSYRAEVYDKRSRRKVRETFSTLAEAKHWRTLRAGDVIRGKQIAPSNITLREAIEGWLAGAEATPPKILTRSSLPYKPGVLREYRRNLMQFVVPPLGAHRLSSIRRGDLQRLIDELGGEGRSGSTVRNVLVPLQAVFRYELTRGESGLETNPTDGLALPASAGVRERAASVGEAAALIAALPLDLRALYATAAYCGLRRGELRALRWNDVDLATNIIRVRRGWDDVAGEIETKSRKARTTPIPALLHDHLAELKARTGRSGDQLVFGRTATEPFTPGTVRKAALGAWAATAVGMFFRGETPAVELDPIGLHELRHTMVSLWSDAGLSLERIGDYVGHSSAYMTDRYRHLLPGHEDEARAKLDAYFALADTEARMRQIESASD